MTEFTHFDDLGNAIMVDVTEKEITVREAIAQGTIRMKPDTLEMILQRKAKKGDVLGVAQVAGIMAVKRTPDLIPLAHPLPISSVTIQFQPDTSTSEIRVEGRVKVTSRTGVEMEALTAVSIACLTIYDMCKAVDREMTITNIRLLEKSGGRSGHFKRST